MKYLFLPSFVLTLIVSLKSCCLSLLILLVLISHETLLKNIRTKRMESEAREVVGHETPHKG